MSLLDSGAPGDHSAVLMDAAEALMSDDLLSYHPIRSRVAGRQSQAASSTSASKIYYSFCFILKLLLVMVGKWNVEFVAQGCLCKDRQRVNY